MQKTIFSPEDSFLLFRSLLSSLIPHAEYRNHPRSGMASDHSSDIIDQDIIDPHLPSYLSRHIIGVLPAVPVGDHDDIILPALRLLRGSLHDLSKRFPAPPLLADHLKSAPVIHMDHRLNLHHAAKHSNRLGDTPPSVKVFQIVNCYIMADMN